MANLLGFIVSPLGRKLGALLAVLVALALVGLTIFNAGADHGRRPAEADRDRWKTTAKDYLRAAHAWEASYREDARLRGEEREEAVTATNAAAKACDTRVAAARKSSAAIQSIITRETVYDPSHCPVRRPVGIERLRDATGLGPAG
jgi:ABC-type transport system involved in cytochrome bd biosynthesis fused ATPase/permease subunit